MMGQLDPPKGGLSEWRHHPYTKVLLSHLKAEHDRMIEMLIAQATTSTDPSVARCAAELLEHERMIHLLERKDDDDE